MNSRSTMSSEYHVFVSLKTVCKVNSSLGWTSAVNPLNPKIKI